MEAGRFYIITGGTTVPVAPHFSLCAPAYGSVGTQIARSLLREFERIGSSHEVVLLRTRMAAGFLSDHELEVFYAAGINFLETNEDLQKLVAYLVSEPSTKGIVMAAAVCDWKFRYLVQQTDGPRTGDGGLETRTHHELGKSSLPRLKTSHGDITAKLMPTDKVINQIRKDRKDIFLVGFKATTGLSEQAQYIEGLRLLKHASCNLVLANDLHEHRNMIIVPEEAKYHVTKKRKEVIRRLCEMIALRSNLTFTRSTVVDGDAIPWDSAAVPANLRKVVDHCIARGAYKPFEGKTVGHFATRGPEQGIIYTSRRKSNFNNLAKDGLIRIDTVGEHEVVAYGGKPSVGGQSQRMFFAQHEDIDCVVHFHSPVREGMEDWVPFRFQRPFECGSHQCGQNAADGLTEIWQGIKAVMLDEHGPNICFSRDADPDRVIQFIETFWDLEAKTGGPVHLEEERNA